MNRSLLAYYVWLLVVALTASAEDRRIRIARLDMQAAEESLVQEKNQYEDQRNNLQKEIFKLQTEEVQYQNEARTKMAVWAIEQRDPAAKQKLKDEETKARNQESETRAQRLAKQQELATEESR